MSQAAAMMEAVPFEITLSPLVGRTDEVQRLTDLVGLGTDRGGAVLLGGDAGAGKSRLLAELSQQARGSGWRVLVGHCLDFGDSSLPYLAFSEAFGRLVTETPGLAGSLLEASPGDCPAAAGPAAARRRRGRPAAHRSGLTARRRTRRARSARGAVTAVAGDRGRPLGRPVDPRPVELPVLPPVRHRRRGGGVLPQRRTSPASSAARCARRMVPAARGHPVAAGPAPDSRLPAS